MSMRFKVRCSACQEKFSTTIWPPKACPNCGVTNDDPDDDDTICMPSIRSMRMASTDKVYRDMERASEERVHQAAAMAGVEPSEMSSLKITNLNDRRDAEIAAMPVNNEVSRQIEQQGPWGFQANASAFTGSVASGAVVVGGKPTGQFVEPRKGARTLNLIKAGHQQP
jgi:hypothetical protein